MRRGWGRRYFKFSQLSRAAAFTDKKVWVSRGRDGEGVPPPFAGAGGGCESLGRSPPSRDPHQVNGHDVPQSHDPPDGPGRVLGQEDEPVAEHNVLERVLLCVGHHDARLIGADGVVDLGRQVPPQERVQTAVRARREAGPSGASHAAPATRQCPRLAVPPRHSVEPLHATKPRASCLRHHRAGTQGAGPKAPGTRSRVRFPSPLPRLVPPLIFVRTFTAMGGARLRSFSQG